MAGIGLSVGRKRFGKGVQPWEASYGRAIAAQMKQIVDNYKKVISAIEVKSVSGLHHALRPIYEESQILVPVDTGKLKRSGYIEVRQNSRGIRGEVGYAKGGNPAYASRVHERMDFYHQPPTQAKFLEEAANRHLGEVVPRYAEYVKSELGL